MAPQRELVIKLSGLRYKAEGISEQEFHDHASKIHAEKAAKIQLRHGALKVTQLHTPKALSDLYRNQMSWAVQPGWDIDDHDIEVSVYVRSPEDMKKILTDPDFQEIVQGETHIIDNSRGTLRAGWEEVYIEDGKIVENVKDGYGNFDDKIKIATEAPKTTGPSGIVL
ncbi:hypothetical protein P280DRAFT_467628 [Massarina eburnea CBS 473.64]|uniref:EthD domain-containing protein n=1 Tax=Massarina eburnea CBS 473.64 TaxID=1395130 RepID=A0A6A6S2X9_9PLEO|nr:hypothetical protein P280DRAFT_467628 [Massarina eburnea CBS 473.64]